MFTTSTLPSTSSVLSMYSMFAATTMLIRTVLNEVQTVTTQLIPHALQTKIASVLGRFLSLDPSSSQLTLYINEYDGMSYNELYQASESYLSTRINDSIGQLKISKKSQEESLSITVNKGQKIRDVFQGIELVWEFVSTETQQIVVNYEDMTGEPSKSEHKTVMLSFHKQHKDKILCSYLPQVMKTFKEIESKKRYVRLYAYGSITGQYDGPWSYINLDHPSTFKTLAMDPMLKNEIIDDLDRFVRRREFYRRVGKPWKRGYLLYGPPGTGKSSLVAAVANHLKFDVYDLELSSVASNGELRRLLTGTANRSIVVIEDIDCTVELQDRTGDGYHHQNGTDNQLTLSGLLNFIDGLWSSCGDERIIIFTTNHKEKLDPALLRPGRMDMHIHMSYCNPAGFRILASNYLQVESHDLFDQIEQLVEEVEVTPAEIAEELMKGEDVDAVLEGVVWFLEKKKMKGVKLENEKVEEVEN